MIVPDLDNPDDAVEKLLTAWFGPGFIVTAFVILNFVVSWTGLIHKTVKSGSILASRLPAAGPARSPLSLTAAAVAIAIQLAWLWFVFLIGNTVAFAFEQPGSFLDGDLTWTRVTSSLEWDTITVIYFGLAVAMLLTAYFLPENTKWPVLVVALPPAYIVIPGVFALLIGLATGAIALMAWLFGVVTWTDILELGATLELDFWGPMLVFYALYAGSCSVAFRLPHLIQRILN